LRATRAK